MARIRLQKYLADCGFGSRRFCETLIRAGRVIVDGRCTAVLGIRIDPETQRIVCNGRVAFKEPPVTLLLNKPPRVICSAADPRGRTTVLDLLDDLPQRVYTVGRLDFMSEGLIVVTNDGTLAHALMHPRFHIKKVYKVWIDKSIGYHQLQKMKYGIPSRGETLRTLEINEGVRTRKGVEYTFTLGEGKNRHIRRMMEHFDIQVFRLMRLAIGPLRLDHLKIGEWRRARPTDLKRLRQAIAATKSNALKK